MNCKCTKPITSPNLTGELCTFCYFATKKLSNPITVLIEEIEVRLDIEKELEENTIVKLGQREKIDEDNPEHIPSKSKETEVPNDGKKYCQSCIERYGNLVLATREWTSNYFICDDCFTPLLNNKLGISNTKEISKIKTEIEVNSPVLDQVYSLLNTPEHLKFNNSDRVNQNYNTIFNYHASANINKSSEELNERIELLQTIFSYIRFELHPITDRINKLKLEEREKKNLTSIEVSRTEVGKTSKVKMSALEKEAKTFGLSLEQYQEFIKSTKEAAFNKIIGKE